VREKELAELKKRKEDAMKLEANELAGKKILVGLAKGVDTFTATQLDPLLKWYGIKNLSKRSVPWKKSKWNEILQTCEEPPPYEKWTDADEEELLKKSQPFSLQDTALGRHEELIARQFKSGVMPKMNKEERAQLRAQLDIMDESDDAPIESAVSIMPNLDIEIESETVAPAAEQELSTDLSPDDVNTDGNLAAM
jgi:hypothetical protein